MILEIVPGSLRDSGSSTSKTCNQQVNISLSYFIKPNITFTHKTGIYLLGEGDILVKQKTAK